MSIEPVFLSALWALELILLVRLDIYKDLLSTITDEGNLSLAQ